MADRSHQPDPGPTPTHERPGNDLPQRHPVPAPCPHPEEPQLPRRTRGGNQ